ALEPAAVAAEIRLVEGTGERLDRPVDKDLHGAHAEAVVAMSGAKADVVLTQERFADHQIGPDLQRAFLNALLEGAVGIRRRRRAGVGAGGDAELGVEVA